MSSVVAPASPDRCDGGRMAAMPPPVMADGDDPSLAVAIDVDAQFDAMISKCQTMVKTAERRHKYEMNGGAATAHLFQGRHRADGADTAAAATAADAGCPADGRDGDDDEFEDVDSYSGAQQRVVYQGGRPHGLPLSPDHQPPFDRPSGSAALDLHPQRYHSGSVGLGTSNPNANANPGGAGLGRPQSLTRSMSPDGFALGSGGAIGGVVPTTPELHQMRDFAEEQRRRTEALRARVAKASTTGAEFPLRTTDCFEDVDVKDVDADTARTALDIQQMTMAVAERRGLSQAPIPSNTHAATTSSGALQSAAQQNGPAGLGGGDGATSRQGSVAVGFHSSRPAPAPWETKQPELDAAVADDEGNALYLALLTAADPDAVAEAFTSAARHGRPAVAKPQSALEHPPFAQAPDTASPVPSSNPAMATHDAQDVKQQGTHPAPAVGDGQSHQPAEKSLAEGGVENQQGGEGQGDPQGAHGAITVGGRPLYEGGVKAPPVTPGAPLAAARDLFNAAGDADVADHKQQHPDHRTTSDGAAREESINARPADDDRNHESHDDFTRDDHRGARARSASANRQAPLMAPLARDSDESKVDEHRGRPNSGGTSSGLVSSTKVSRRHAPPPPPKDDTSDDSFIVHHVDGHAGHATGDGVHSYTGVPVFGGNQHQRNQPQDQLDHHHAGQRHATSGHPLSHGQREALGPASSTWTPAPSAGVSVSRPPPPAPELSDHHHQDHHDGSQAHLSQQQQQYDSHAQPHHLGAPVLDQKSHLQHYHQSPQGQEVSPGGPPAVPLQETHDVPSAADGRSAQHGEEDLHLGHGMMNSDGGDMMTLPPPNVVDGFQPEQRLPTRGYVESVQQQRPPPAHLVGAASSSQQGGEQHPYHNGPNQHEQEGQGQQTNMAAAPDQHQHHPQEVADDTALPPVPTPDASAIERGGQPDSYINAFREPGEVTPSRFGFGETDGGAQGDDGRSAATQSGADGALASSPTAAETAASVQRSGLTDDHLFDLPTEKDDSASLYPKPPAALSSDNAAEAGGFSDAGGGAANGTASSMPAEGGGAPSGLPPLAPGQLAAGPSSSSSRPSPRVPVRPVAAPNGLVPTPMAGYDDFESEAGSPDGHHHPLRDGEGSHGVGENEARARARRTPPPPPPPPPAPALPPKLPTKRSPTSTNPLAPGDTPPPASPFADTAPLPSATLHHGSSSGDGGPHGNDRHSSSHDGQRRSGGNDGRDSGRKSRRDHRNSDRLSNSNSRSNESNEEGVTSGDGTGTRTREPTPVLGMPRPRRHGPPDDDDEDEDTRLPPSSSKTKPARRSDSKQNQNQHSADGQRSPTSRHRRHRSESSPRNGNDRNDDRMDRKESGGGNHPRPGVGGHRGDNDDDDEEEDDRSSSGSYSYSYTYMDTDGGSSDQWSDGNISDFLEEDFGPGPGPGPGGRKSQQRPDGVSANNRPEVRGGPKQSGGQPQGRRDGDRRARSGQAPPPPVRPNTRRAVAGSSGGGQTQAPVRMAAAARTVMAARRLERNMGGNPNAVRPHPNPNPNQHQNPRNSTPGQQGVPPGMASSSALVPHGSSIAGPPRGDPTKPSRGGMSGASSYQLQPRPSSQQAQQRPQSAVRDPYAVQLRSHSAGGLPPAAAYRSASGQSFHTQKSMSMPPGKSGPPGQWSQSPVPPNPHGNQDVNDNVQQRGPRPGQHPRVVYPSATSEGRSRTPTAMAHHRSADGFLHDESGGPGLSGGGGGRGGAPPRRTPFTQVVPPAEFARMLGSDARKEHPDIVKVDPMRAQVAAVLAGHPEGVHSPLDTARGDMVRGGEMPRAQSHNMRGRHAHAHSASPLRYGTGEKDISDGAPGIAGDGAGAGPSYRDLSMNSAGPTRSASAVAAAVAASHRAAVARGESHFGHTTARDGQPPALLPPPPSGSQVSTGGASLAHNSLLNPGVPPSHGGFTGAGGVGGSAAHRTASPGGPPGYYSGVLGLTHGPPQSKSFIPGSAGYAGGEPAPPLPKTRPSLNGARPSNAGAGLNGLTSQRQSPRPHHQPKNDAHQQGPAHSSSMRGRPLNAGSSAGSRPPTPPRPAGNSRQSPTPMAIQMAFGQQPPVASPSVPPSPNQTPRGPRDASGRDGGREQLGQHGHHPRTAALAPPDVTPGPGRVAGTRLAPPDMTPAPAGHEQRSSTPPPKSQVPHGPAPTVRLRPSSVGRAGGATPRASEVQVPGDRKNTPRGC